MKIIRLICLVSGIAHAILFYVLLTQPEAVIASFGLDTTETVAFLGRRTAMLFLGLSMLSLYTALNKMASSFMIFILALPWLALAFMGGFEYQRGYVGAEVFPAIGTEITIGSLLVLASLLRIRIDKGITR